MGSIGRYIFRATLGAFLLVLISLTTAVWMTQALRDIDLMTSQGQTVLTFVAITGLIVPLLMMVIAPIALVVAVSHILHKLSSDSEIIVLNGSGVRPMRLLQPFLWASLVVTAFVLTLSAYLAPHGMLKLRQSLVEIRADLLSTIVQPGRFTQIEGGLSFHIRERRPNGLLVGVLLDDRRDPKERVTILAEQGEILKNPSGSFLILENGSIQRHEQNQRDPSIVRFERYAFDLSRFATGTTSTRYSVRELYLWQLIWPDPNDPQYKDEVANYRVELHDRLASLLYPITFVLVAFAFLGAPRTTRQSASWAIATVIFIVVAIRLIGFAGAILVAKYPAAAVIQYAVAGGAIVACFSVISRGKIIEPPTWLTQSSDRLQAALMKRFGRLLRPAS